MNLSPELLDFIKVLVGAIFGGVGGELIRFLRSRIKDRQDDEAQFRKELRGQVLALTKRLDSVQLELDSWKNKYYELLGRWTVQQAENDDLRKENETLKREIAQLRKEVEDMRGKGAQRPQGA